LVEQRRLERAWKQKRFIKKVKRLNDYLDWYYNELLRDARRALTYSYHPDSVMKEGKVLEGMVDSISGVEDLKIKLATTLGEHFERKIVGSYKIVGVLQDKASVHIGDTPMFYYELKVEPPIDLGGDS